MVWRYFVRGNWPGAWGGLSLKVNLLPLDRRKNFKPHWAALAVFLGLALLTPLWYYSYSFQNQVKLLDERQTDLKARTEALQPLDDLLRERALLEQELQRIKGQPLPVKTGMVQLLDEIARLLPDNLFVTSLSVSDSFVLLEGVTPSYALAAEFLKVLAGSELFEAPSLGFLRRDTGGHTFTVTARIRRASPE